MATATDTTMSLSTDEVSMLEAMMAKATAKKASKGVSKADYWTRAAKSLETASETQDLIRERKYHQTGDRSYSTYR